MRFLLLLWCVGVAGCLTPLENPEVARARQGLGDGGDSGMISADPDGSVRLYCDDLSPCGTGQVCVNNGCVADTDAGTGNCTIDSDCYPTGDFCYLSVCSCGDTGTLCATGDTCSAGLCSGLPLGGGTGTTGGGTGSTGGGFVATGGGTGTDTCDVTCQALELGTSCNANNQCLCGTDVCGFGEKCHDGRCSALCIHRPRDNDNLPFTACIGRPEFELGASVSMCSPTQFVVGAPGGNAMMLFTAGDGGWLRTDGTDGLGRFGAQVLCRPQTPVFGGPGGVRSLMTSGGWHTWWDHHSYALAGDGVQSSATPQFLGTAQRGDGGHVLLRSNTSGLADTPYDTADPGFGYSMVSGPYVAVGVPAAAKGTVELFSGDLSSYSKEIVISEPGAGLALAMGDVFPGSGNDDGLELLIASRDNVFFYREDKQLRRVPIMETVTFSGSSAPPISLAVETRPVTAGSSVHAWWYGVPGHNLVHRCVGTYCFASNPVTTENAAFGAAIGISGSTLVIGAPAYDGGSQGAVFIINLDDFDGGAYTGSDQICPAHGAACCTANAQLGQCLGEVFCAVPPGTAPSPYCLPADGGVDAGIDAGVDAGSDDAGTDGGSQNGSDGGTDDGPTPVDFATCGCSSANGAFVTLALALLMLRRKAAAR